MNLFIKLKERYIIHKSYNIVILRVIMYACAMVPLLWTLLPMVYKLPSIERVTSLMLAFVSFSLAYIVGYLFDVILFYIIFKKYVDNSMRMAEKQVAPLLFLQLLVPFLFNLIGCFINIPSFTLTIEILKLLIAVLYLGYAVFSNVFKEKCVSHLIAYLVLDRVFEVLAVLIKTGIQV